MFPTNCGGLVMLSGTERVLRTIDAIEAAADSQIIFEIFKDFSANYGFRSVYIAQLVNPANVAINRRLHLTNWPEELLQSRRRRISTLQDPIAQVAMRSKRPFLWSNVRQQASPTGKKTLDEARDFKINDGLMFPVHAIDCVPGGISVGAEVIDVSRREISEIEIVAQHTYYRLELQMGPSPYKSEIVLSSRETEVIQIAAAGKTNGEIARVIGVSEETVKSTISRASRKLNATNRAHAVATAIAHGLIMA
jgi:LuxR family transcriptional regulator, quorum-sensing system regulator BjaR1